MFSFNLSLIVYPISLWKFSITERNETILSKPLCANVRIFRRLWKRKDVSRNRSVGDKLPTPHPRTVRIANNLPHLSFSAFVAIIQERISPTQFQHHLPNRIVNMSSEHICWRASWKTARGKERLCWRFTIAPAGEGDWIRGGDRRRFWRTDRYIHLPLLFQLAFHGLITPYGACFLHALKGYEVFFYYWKRLHITEEVLHIFSWISAVCFFSRFYFYFKGFKLPFWIYCGTRRHFIIRSPAFLLFSAGWLVLFLESKKNLTRLCVGTFTFIRPIILVTSFLFFYFLQVNIFIS